jgi:helicase-exonuclease AddAB, AddA subunit, Firmicutes type
MMAEGGITAQTTAGPSWTEDQLQAIEVSGRNVLVAAAAGSGKTAVLVERIIRKISSDTDVDRLLVATFTNAAAAEMKERIRLALEQALERNPGSDHLRRQLALMGRASITTLHSFCLDVIRRYYPLIGLDPGFRVANETEAELLQAETLQDLFEERYAGDRDGRFTLLAETFGGDRSDEPLARLVLELHRFALSHPWPEAWLRASAAAFRTASADNLADSDWGRDIRRAVQLELEAAEALLEQALAGAMRPDGPEAYADTLRDDLAVVGALLETVRSKPMAEWFGAFRGASFGQLKRQRGDAVDKDLQERVKALRDDAKKIVGGLADELFGRTLEEYAAELNDAAPLMEALAELVIEFGRRYEAAKRARGLVDFGDLEHYCLRILRDPASTPEREMPSAAALEYREQFEEILLDEYQDTNQVQEAIIDLIARPGAGNRFMVGDVKQSIYRFRLAEPGLFLDKYRRYAAGGAAGGDAAEGANDAPGLRIDLARNFRSRKEVVDGVNDVFRRIMRERAAEMDYDERAELKCGASYPDADPELDGDGRFSVECVLLDRGAASGGAEDGEAEEDEAARAAAEEAAELETAQIEARWIAARIRAMIAGEDGRPPLRVYDAKRRVHRRAAWRDFVILLRAPGTWAQAMADELAAAGIPAYAEQKGGYFEQTEVETVLSLLRVIDNPYQDIPLAGVLRSPIGGLDAEELAAVRIAARRGPFFDAVRSAAEDPDVPERLRRKLNAFLGRLERWRREARQGSLTELVRRIYRETGYYDLAGGLPGGVQRQANLQALLDRARQYEATSFRGLFRFLRFIDRLRDQGGDLGTAKTLGEQDDVVRIMSIHASKGLEFPVVFVAGLGKRFNFTDLNGAFLMHKQLGFGPRMVDPDLRVSYPSLPLLAIRRRLKAEMLAEEMRVLYVAMTRPKEKMILLGTTKDAAAELERWRGAVRQDGSMPDHALTSARCYLDWLMPLAARFAEPEAEAVPDADAAEGAAALGWKFGVTPAELLIAEAAAAAEADAEAEDERGEWLRLMTAGERLPSPGGHAAEVDRRLSWRYPHAAATGIAAKTSVTEMKRMLADAEADGGEAPAAGLEHAAAGGGEASAFRLRRPRFLEERSMTPAERGTAAHLIMQHMPFDRPHGEDSVREVVRSMVERRLLTPAQAEAVDCAAIAAFFAGELGRRLAAARRVMREVPFSRTLPAGRIRPDAADDPAAAAEPVLIQGVIDCLFEDEGGRLVLVDYKTDRIWSGDVEAAAERHRFQLELYAESIGAILGRKVDEAHVFFFDAAKAVRIV